MSYDLSVRSILLMVAVSGPFFLSGCVSALNRAAQDGNVAEIKRLVAQGADVNEYAAASNSGHDFPLNEAVANNHVEAARALLEAGASTTGTDSMARTPLDIAVEFKPNIEMVRLLLEHGADPTIKRSWPAGDNRTALDLVQNARLDGMPRIDEIRRMMFAAAGKRSRKNRELAALASGESEPAPAAPSAVPAAPAPSQAVDTLVPTFSEKTKDDDFAVIIGIENYADLPAARFAERDAASMKSFVRAMGVPERNIMTLTGSRATRTGLAKAFEAWLPNNVNEKSRVIVFYSGHGAPDVKTKQAYLVPVDGDPQYLEQTGYPLERLYSQLNKLKTKNVLVALDSCFSGAGGRSVVPAGTRPLVGKVDAVPQSTSRIAVLSASDGDQISGSKEEAGYGLFTYNLLNGLNGGAKDARGQVTLKSLYDYVKPKVQDEARRANREQTPQLQCPSSDSFILRAN